MKKKRSYKKQVKSQVYKYSDDKHFPYETKKSPTPIQMGFTSNKISSKSSSILMNKNSPSIVNSIENRDKQVSAETSVTSSNTINPLPTNDDVIETVNEVLGMEERNGKLYYKVNFTGHALDYTAWVCEDDLIPE